MSKGDFQWNNIKIVDNNNENPDYYVIINIPNTNEYDPKKTIVFQMEPRCNNDNQNWGVKTWKQWADPDESLFLEVRTHKKYYNNCAWLLGKYYSDFLNGDFTKNNNNISTICSSKYYDPGHIKRVDFLKYIEENHPDFNIDIYGTDNNREFKNYKGTLSSDNKSDGVVPYKYYFMAENNQEYNYITEKFWEPIISECLCFYWGALNLEDYIDSRAFVRLDLDDFEKSYNIIKNAIDNDLYSERIEIIRKEKYKVLNYYNFFPTIERIITKDIFKQILPELITNNIIYILCDDITNINYKIIPFIKSIQDIGLNVLYYKKPTNILSLIDFYQNLNQNIDQNIDQNIMVLDEEAIISCSLKKVLYHLSLLKLDYDIINIDVDNSIKNNFKIKNIYCCYYYSIRNYFFKNSFNHFINKKGISKIISYINNLEKYPEIEDLFYELNENINDFNFYTCSFLS
jgi:hypothetical protein